MSVATPIVPIDMGLYKDKLSTEEMRAIWCEENILRQRLYVEAVLSDVEADMGIIPREAADEIISMATLEHVTLEEYAEMYAYKGHDIVALVWVLASKCENHGEWVHWRSTTQDILWTSTALLFKETFDVLLKDLLALEEVLIDMAERYASTPMAGRTHGQYCPPITFGFSLGIQALAVRRHIDRLKQCRERLLVGKITSAVGTGSSYGPTDQAFELQERICERLGLAVPPITESEATRDRVAEFGTVCGMVATNLEKMARDIWTLQRPEIDELAEPFRTGEQVGSSTLAHKRNPFACEWVQGAARLIRANVVPLSDILVSDIRDGVRLAVEYTTIPSIANMTSASIRSMTKILSGLDVKTDNMMRNMDASNGLMMDEPVMLRLADLGVGRQSAHDMVYDAAMEAHSEGRHLRDVLLENPRAKELITAEEIDELMKYENYLGTAPLQVAQTVEYIRSARKADLA